MSDLRKAAEMALEALDAYSWEQVDAATKALRQALAQSEQGNNSPNYPNTEPNTSFVDAINISQERVDETAKRKHEWVGLTDEEVEAWRGNYDFFDSALVRKVEAKLKEKNV